MLDFLQTDLGEFAMVMVAYIIGISITALAAWLVNARDERQRRRDLAETQQALHKDSETWS